MHVYDVIAVVSNLKLILSAPIRHFLNNPHFTFIVLSAKSNQKYFIFLHILKQSTINYDKMLHEFPQIPAAKKCESKERKSPCEQRRSWTRSHCNATSCAETLIRALA